jgi:hypothetical protein
MTAQIFEIFFESEKHAMCTNPLWDYCARGEELPNFASSCTALWWRYVGTLEVINDRFYMVELSGEIASGEDANIETVFPGYGDRVFAFWYSGTIRLPQGKMLVYLHMSYGSSYERDLLLEFKKSILTSRLVKVNGVSEGENASECGSIGAMTLLAKNMSASSLTSSLGCPL